MKIIKRKFRQKAAFLLISAIVILNLSSAGCLVSADTADEADAVMKLYNSGQLIGKYSDLKTLFANMTDKQGDYKIIFPAEQTEYKIDGEVWLPECKSIKFVGIPVNKEEYRSTAIKINHSIHLQSDVVLSNCTIYECNVSEMSVMDIGSHKLEVTGKYTEIIACVMHKYDWYYYNDKTDFYYFRIEGQDGSELIIDNNDFMIDIDLNIDTVRLEKDAGLRIKSGQAKIKKVIAKDYLTNIIYDAYGRYEIGEISIHNCWLYIDMIKSTRVRIGKISLAENTDSDNCSFIMSASISSSKITKKCHPRFEIENIDDDGIDIFFSMYIYEKIDYDTALKPFLHNDISCLKMPKDYDISKLKHYQIQYKNGYENFNVIKDKEGNVWLPMIEQNGEETDEELTYELDEEQNDKYGIYYKLNKSEKTATVGADNDKMANAGFNDTSKLDDRVLRVPSYVKYDGENYKVTRVGKSAFESAGVGFDEVYIPDTVVSIGDKAFWRNTIYKLYIGANVSEIGELAIAAAMTDEIYLDKNNTNYILEQGVLFDKDMTTLIRCPAELWNQYYPVYNVPESVKKIAAGAFAYAHIFNIKADNVTSVGEYAFYNAVYLRTVSLKGVVEIGDRAFLNSRILRNVYLSDKLKKIGGVEFWDCDNLECLVLPDSVTDIGEYAFSQSGIKYILGGKNAQYGQQMFLNCKNLTLVQLSDAAQYLPKQLFKGCTSLEKLYLPENCLGSEDNELFYDIPENQVTVYGKEDMSEFAKNNNALFENVTEHEHNFVTQTVQEARAYDTGLEVTYCSECHYVSDYREIDAPEQFEKTSDYGILEELVHPPNEPTPSPATPPAVTQTPAVSASPTPKPSASPTPTAPPTLIPTVSPVMTPAPAKTPTVTVKPTKTPAATATVPSPTPIMTGSPPVVSPTAIPINSTSAMPNGHVSSKPDKEPEPTSGNKTTPNPTDRTTPQPADNASPSLANEPLYTISPTPTSATPQPTSVPGLSEKDKKALIVRINLIELTKYNQPEIVWKKTSVNIGYEIYRAMSKKITWKKIAAGETNSSCRYTDKKAKAGQKYYYKIRLFKKTGAQKYYGKYSNVCMIKTLSIVKPKIKGTTGTYRKMPYVQIELKKYSGIYAEIYIRGKDKKYQKIKLKSSSIKRYNAKFKLKCNNKKAVYYFKVRTIVKRVKKKYYSVYSDCLKVKVKGS